MEMKRGQLAPRSNFLTNSFAKIVDMVGRVRWNEGESSAGSRHNVPALGDIMLVIHKARRVLQQFSGTVSDIHQFGVGE